MGGYSARANLTQALSFRVVIRLFLLLVGFALLCQRDIAAGADKVNGLPSRQTLIIQAQPAEPITKLPQPTAPGIDSQPRSASVENEPKIEIHPARPILDPDAARKLKIKSERERLNTNAVQWQRERAAAGSTIAIRSLGMRYMIGDGVVKDPVKGMDLLRKAAAGGDSAAKRELAKIDSAKKE